MMHTLRFEQCIGGPDMTPCLCEKCSVYEVVCPFLMRIEITYYDNALIRVTMNNIILDSMVPEELRDKMNAEFKVCT